MALEVSTQDCTTVSDEELAEMLELVAETKNPFGESLLKQQTEDWVLCTTAREDEKLRGFAFFTLERIGGTPAVLIGLLGIAPSSRRSSYLRGLMGELYHRALMAFPDEDVLLGAQFNQPSALETYKELTDLIPRPGYKTNGEERAWGSRVAKRFGLGISRYRDRKFFVTGKQQQPPVIGYESLEETDPALVEMFEPIDFDNGDTLVIHGWVSPERLIKLGS